MTVYAVNFERHPDAYHALGLLLPTRATSESSGYDLRADIDRPWRIAPGVTYMVPTGLIVQLDPRIEMQIRPRSGLAAKHGITIANAPGTVDSDYRGQVFVALVNLCDDAHEVGPLDRIAQAVFQKKTSVVTLAEGDHYVETFKKRSGGFGSTGVR